MFQQVYRTLQSSLNKNHDKLQQLLCHKRTNCSMNIQNVPTTPQYSVPANRECVEVQIPAQWGYIRGKWWGPTDKRPILCLHGWQDNCGSFDRLIPYLPQDVGYLAIDSPGHGFSSKIPHGFFYSLYGYALLLRKIAGNYEWKNLSLIGHSLGGIQSFIYSALFSSQVDLYVAIDIMVTLTEDHSNDIKKIYSERIDKLIRYMNMQYSEPPSYPYEKCVDIYIKGTKGTVDDVGAKILLNRGLKKSIKNPNHYYFSRDSRLKVGNIPAYSPEECLKLAGGIDNPFLFIKAKNSPAVSKSNFTLNLLNMLKNTGKPNFEFVERAGTHHLHLLEPQNIADDISNFITKYSSQDRSQRSHIIDEIFVKKYY